MFTCERTDPKIIPGGLFASLIPSGPWRRGCARVITVSRDPLAKAFALADHASSILEKQNGDVLTARFSPCRGVVKPRPTAWAQSRSSGTRSCASKPGVVRSRLSSGAVFYGTPRRLLQAVATARLLAPTDMVEVVRLTPIDQKFWQQLDGR